MNLNDILILLIKLVYGWIFFSLLSLASIYAVEIFKLNKNKNDEKN